jgi:hypothetical protein
MTTIELKKKIKTFLKTKRKVGYSIAELLVVAAYAMLVLAVILLRNCGGAKALDEDPTFVMDGNEYAQHFEEHIISFLEKYKAPRETTDFLVIHHSAGNCNASAEDVQEYHIPLYGDIAYHYLYYPCKKKIVQVRELDEGAPHAYSMNYNSVAICVMGNFNEQSLDSLDIMILRTLITQLRDIYSLGPECVIGHDDCIVYNRDNNTACPGAHIHTSMFVPRITEQDYERLISEYMVRTNNKFTEYRLKKMPLELAEMQLNKAQFEAYAEKEYNEMVTTIKNKK